MKKIVFIILFLVLIFTKMNAQLKVGQSGGVGLGIEPRIDYKLAIKGNLMLTTYPEIPAPLPRYTEFRIKVGNGSPGCEFGTPTRKIAVWSSEVGYNDLYASHYYSQSDESVKTDIVPVSNALNLIRSINAYTYKLKLDSLIDEKTSIGFLAQEIHEILPDITDTVKGIILVDYQQIIPLLVEAIKEQQNTIDSLKDGGSQQRVANVSNNKQESIDSLIDELRQMKEIMNACCSLNQSTFTKSSKDSYQAATLYQNKPNPFSERTIIEFEINKSFQSAFIMVFDLQGNFKFKEPIFQKGKGQITIQGQQLGAGMYLYSLILDKVEVDTKRMILLD